MKQVKMGAFSYALMLKYMDEGVYSCADLAEMTGLHLVTVYQYTREIHAAGVAHIALYEPDARGRHNIKVFKLGAGKDAKKPRLSGRARQARCREKKDAIKLAHVMAGTGRFVPANNGRKRFELLEK